jgi:DNA-binding response OmpR family regulator
MNEMPKILAVDDDPEVLGTLTRALTRDDYSVQSATSGQEALEILNHHLPDLIVLDVMMPGMSGIEVCKQIRLNKIYNHIPILFLTARSQTNDVVVGLDAGADDYVTKPFEVSELQARIRAILRRIDRDNTRTSDELSVEGLVLDSATHRVSYGQNTIQLTSTEQRLLRYLMEHPNQALSPTHLLEYVWGYPSDAGDPDLVRAHIRNLRNKLTELDSQREFIQTLHGIGYMIGS